MSGMVLFGKGLSQPLIEVSSGAVWRGRVGSCVVWFVMGLFQAQCYGLKRWGRQRYGGTGCVRLLELCG